MPHEIFDRILANPLAKFCQKYPGIELKLEVKPGLKNIANREADLAVRITPAPPDYLIGKRITYIQHGLYANREWYQKVVEGNHQIPIILWPHIKSLPDWTETFHQAKMKVYVDDLASMHQAVKSGMGIARMPCFYPDSVKDPDVIRMPIPLDLSSWGIWLLNHVDLRNSARINKCKQVLTNNLSENIPLFMGEQSQSPLL